LRTISRRANRGAERMRASAARETIHQKECGFQ
jgi:hypothetical protein